MPKSEPSRALLRSPHPEAKSLYHEVLAAVEAERQRREAAFIEFCEERDRETEELQKLLPPGYEIIITKSPRW